LWMRETEASSFDTPERRAALEARVNEVTGAIGHDSVRKYYRQDFAGRLATLLRPSVPVARPTFRRGNEPGGWRGRAGFGKPPEVLAYGRAYVVASPQLAASPILRGARSAIPRREALILQAIFNHPWLLQEHLEELAHLDFRHADAQKLKEALIDIFAHDGSTESEGLRRELAARGLQEVMQRVETAITTMAVWGARQGAAP